MYTRISWVTCSRETGNAPIKTGWAETDNQWSPTYARGGSRRSTRRTRGQSCTRQRRHSRRWKLCCSEIATDTRGGKVVAYAPARRRVYRRASTRGLPARKWTLVRAVAIQSVRHARRCTKLGRWAGIYTQQSKVDERKRVVRVERSHQGRGHRCNSCMEMTSQLMEKGQQRNSSSEWHRKSTRSRSRTLRRVEEYWIASSKESWQYHNRSRPETC